MSDAGHANEPRATKRWNYLGDTDAEAYQRGIEMMSASLGDHVFSGDFATLKQCVSSDKKALALSYKVEPYRFCSTKEDVGYVLPSTSVDVPERAE